MRGTLKLLVERELQAEKSSHLHLIGSLEKAIADLNRAHDRLERQIKRMSGIRK